MLRATLALGIAAFLLNESSLPAIDATNLRITTPLNLAFFLAGAFLYRRGFDDLRARLFGCTFLLIASVYSQLAYPLVSTYLAKSCCHRWP